MNNFEQKQKMSQEQLSLLEIEMDKQRKSMTVMILLWIFLGGLGVHRFYLGYTGRGVCLLLFGWLTFGIWNFIDGLVAIKTVKDHNENAETEIIQKIKLMNV